MPLNMSTQRSMNNLEESVIRQPVLNLLQQIHQEFAPLQEGKVASYIPELAKANPDWFGICIVTATGAVYEVGDTAQPFTIQSISKPFVYGMALEDNGRPDVLQKVGVEPTGDAFNSISLEPGTGRPRNPMINAGAIATTGLIAGLSHQSKLKRMLSTFAAYAGRELSIDETVYHSENDTGHRNRAIGHMLRNFDILVSDPIPVVELYFKQCSISVTCRDLGIMAATLGNRGINPLTGRQAIRGEYVKNVLSVMESCGTYDFAGEWIYNVGLPAKSGVAGGIIAVLPGQMGIGVYSPPLDERGNSVRGIRVCQELSRSLDLHQLSRAAMGRVTIRARLNAAERNSSRVRSKDEQDLLRKHGRGIQTYQLQGTLTFTTTEVVVREIIENAGTLQHLILDLRRVVSIDQCSCEILHLTLRELLAQDKSVHFVHTKHLPLLRRFTRAKLGSQFDLIFSPTEDIDPTLEWCEDKLLETVRASQGPGHSRHHDYELFKGFTADQLAIVRSLLKRKRYESGVVIFNAGDDACDLYFLAEGHVSVLVTSTPGSRKRLATFTAGMAFGEMAVIDGAPRSAMIVADTAVEVDTLSLDEMDWLGQRHPSIKIKLLENLCFSLSGKLRKANREMALLE
jgi:glutaminase